MEALERLLVWTEGIGERNIMESSTETFLADLLTHF